MRRLPRIAMYCRFFRPDTSGAGIQALTLSRKLRGLGHDVMVVAENTNRAPKRESVDGIPVYRFAQLKRGAGYIDLLVYWLRITRTLFALRGQFDIIHAHGVNFEISFVAVIARLLKKPILMKTTHAGDLSSADHSVSRRLQYLAIRHVDLFIAISRDLLAEYRTNPALPRNKVELVPNGVDTERFAPLDPQGKRDLREELGLPESPVLVYHGVLEARKALDWFILATEDLLAAGKFTLLVVGDPARDEAVTGYHRELLRRTQRLMASGSIVMQGFREDVYRYLQASDAYVLPSRGEGLSNALLEAMAVGLVPIASRTSGTKDLIEHGRNGLTFGVDNRRELREAVGYYLAVHGTDGADALSVSARQTIERQYSLDSIARTYSGIYRRLLAEGR